MDNAKRSTLLTCERVDPTSSQEAGKVRQRRIARCYQDYVASYTNGERDPVRGDRLRRHRKRERGSDSHIKIGPLAESVAQKAYAKGDQAAPYVNWDGQEIGGGGREA